MSRDEELIDLMKLAKIFWAKKITIVVIIAVCMAIGAAVGLRQPKVYESSSIVQINGDAWNIASVAYPNETDWNTKGAGNGTLISSYLEIMKSPAVNKDAVTFDVKNIRGTNLLSISAKGSTAEEAQQATKGIVDNFLAFQTEQNKESKEKMADFLTRTAETAKNDLEIADKELAAAPVNESDPNYRQLKRNAKVKEEIYISLLKEAEQNKIRQTTESMDIQIVTPANLPDAPIAGKTKLYIIDGFVAGCLLSLLYGLVKYRIG